MRGFAASTSSHSIIQDNACSILCFRPKEHQVNEAKVIMIGQDCNLKDIDTIWYNEVLKNEIA
jgi:hypothetical protein